MMQTATPTAPAAVTHIEVLHFIHQYRVLEKNSLEETFKLFGFLYKHQPANFIGHICDQWRWKKRSFGDFFLNLDRETQIPILRHFGVKDPELDRYLHQLQQDPIAVLFTEPPASMKAYSNVLLFMCNHSIHTGSCGFDVPFPPKNTYGNSAHWGDYIIALPTTERRQLIANILNHYQL